MLRGLPASLLLHLGVVGAGYIAFPYAERPPTEVVIVPVELVVIAEENNVAPVRKREAEALPEVMPQPEPVEPDIEDYLEDVDTLPDEIAPLEEVVPPPPTILEEPAPVEEETLPEEPETDPEPETPEPEKSLLPQPDALDALLADDVFKTDEPDLIDLAEKEPVKAPAPKVPEPREEQIIVTASRIQQRGIGERTANEARVESLLWSQMEICWETVADLPDPERLSVTVIVDLKRDGTLKGDARVVSPRRVQIGDRFMRQAVDRALRAARKCQPYRMPEEDYDIWQEITMNFKHGRG